MDNEIKCVYCCHKDCGQVVNTDELYVEVEGIGKFHIECFYKRFRDDDIAQA